MGLMVAIGLTLLLGGIPFALGKYIELNSPDPYDGGAYVYSAQHLLNGARLWVDEKTSAMPATLLVNLIGVKLFGFSDVGPKLVQMLLQGAALAMMFYTLRRLFGAAAAVVSTSLAAILLSAPVIAKFGDVKEQFMISFALVAACAFALHETNGKKHWAVLAGAASIIPYYFKATGIAIVVAIGLYLIVKLIVPGRNWKAVFLTLFLWAAGAALGLCFPASLFVWQQGLSYFWKTFPVVLLQSIVLFALLTFAVFAIVHYTPWRSFWSALRSVSRTLWIRGAVLIVAMLIFSVALIGFWKGSIVKQDIPSYLRSIPCVRVPMQGGRLLYSQAYKILRYSGLLSEGGYVGQGRQIRSFSEQAPQVFRYYHAVGAITWSAAATTLLAAALWLRRRLKKQKADSPLHAVAGFAALWWMIDMTLVWVSPHSYEQYYLPLCASGAMLVAYAVWCWKEWLTRSAPKMPAVAAAGVAVLSLCGLLFPVFAGFAKSPDTGVEYKNYRDGQPERRRGFAQSLAAIGTQGTAPWQAIGDHIRANSTPDDTLYVWGWFPGIYVRAQRMAPVPQAYEADMHVTPPYFLAVQIKTLVSELEKNLPKFIVDSRKQHFPFNRPPLELWPIVPEKMFGNAQPQLLGADPRQIEAFEKAYAEMLRQRFGDDEAARFAAMKPFRDLVMTRYRLAQQFGNHMLFERKD